MEGNHTFSEYTLETWGKAIPREQCEQLWLPSEIFPIPVMVNTRLKACNPPHWLCCEASDVIHVVEMQDS